MRAPTFAVALDRAGERGAAQAEGQAHKGGDAEHDHGEGCAD
jgi:hypothetical protein